MDQQNKLPEFRFYYFTDKYAETVTFYRDFLQLQIIRSWDRGPCQKGTIFESPNQTGWIEIEEGESTPILQCGLYLEVADVDHWHALLIERKVRITQTLSNTSYGHRSFKIEDPNQLTIGFFCYA